MATASRALLSRAASPSSSVRSPRPRPFSRLRPAGRCGATPRSRQPRRCATRPPAGATGRQRRRSSLTDATSTTGSSSWRRRPATAPKPTRDEIIDSYIKTLAQVVGSEEEARMKIYSVSTRHYFAFGALVSEELSYKLKELPKVSWVLPDSYLDVKNKDYGGEPFINGEAVPYDPKYHEEWVRNNARANERSRRNDRPRNFDRSRNFERRRENQQNFQNRDVPPGQGFNGPPPPGQNHMPLHEGPPMQHGPGMPPPPPPTHAAGGPPNYQPQMPNPQAGYDPSANYQQGPPAYQGGPTGYQGYQGNPGPAYPGSNPGYQGGAPGYQGPPYQGGNPNTHPYQGGGNPGYSSGAPGYPGQGGNQNYQ